ncbi:MAG: PH domain-containing protein [Bacteroides sp.]|nr:PH domain-containing protein [Bacteroides sp.]
MKSRVYLSTTSSILTILVIGLLLLGCVATYGSDKFLLMLIATLVILVVSMFYAPLSISATEKEVEVHSPFKIHSIPMRRIVNCELFRPTMGALRVCGSGGFMGYWGIFSEGDVGRYVAYYGKGSDCFMIRLDNGDKYVIGCKNPEEMVKYINSQITR